MNIVKILHRSGADANPTILTPALDKFTFSKLRQMWYRNEDGVDKFYFGLGGDCVSFKHLSFDSVAAAIEMLKVKGVDEIVPIGNDDFLIMCHQVGLENNIEVVHPDMIED